MVDIQKFKGKTKLKQPISKTISLSIGDCGPVIKGIPGKRKPNRGMFYILNAATVETYLKGRLKQTCQTSWFGRETHGFDSDFTVSR